MRENKTREQIGAIVGAEYGLNHVTVQKQYDRIISEMSSELREGRDQLAALLIERNHLIYELSLDQGQLKTALDANNSIAKIAGLFSDKPYEQPKTPQFVTIREKDQSGQANGK